MASIWSSTGVTPASTDRIPVDVSSSGAPSHWTGQNVADAAGLLGVTVNALGSINTNTTINWSSGSYVTATIAGSLTFTFSGAPAKGFIGTLVLTNGGSATITWPGTVTWAGATAPTLRAAGVDVLRFYSADGTNWFGELAQDEQSLDAGNINAGTLALARGGTGASLTDPNADRILFWDDSAGAVAWLQLGGLASITDTTLSVTAAAASDVNAGTSTTAAMTPGSYKDSTPYYVTRGASGDHTLVLSDANVDQWFDSSSNRVLNLVANSSVAFATGTKIPVIRLGSGTVTIDAPTGVTLNGVNGGSCTINTRYQGALLTKTSTDAWVISGDVSTVA